MADLITFDDLVVRTDEERLLALSPGDTADDYPRIADAISRASAEALSYIDKAYKVEGFAYPTEIEPLRGYVVSLAYDWLTKGLDLKPDWIKEDAKEAREWLRLIGAGKAKIEGLGHDSPGSYFTTTSHKREGVFDTANKRSPLMKMFPDY